MFVSVAENDCDMAWDELKENCDDTVKSLIYCKSCTNLKLPLESLGSISIKKFFESQFGLGLRLIKIQHLFGAYRILWLVTVF
jgi:hypothetical protein